MPASCLSSELKESLRKFNNFLRSPDSTSTFHHLCRAIRTEVPGGALETEFTVETLDYISHVANGMQSKMDTHQVAHFRAITNNGGSPHQVPYPIEPWQLVADFGCPIPRRMLSALRKCLQHFRYDTLLSSAKRARDERLEHISHSRRSRAQREALEVRQRELQGVRVKQPDDLKLGWEALQLDETVNLVCPLKLDKRKKRGDKKTEMEAARLEDRRGNTSECTRPPQYQAEVAVSLGTKAVRQGASNHVDENVAKVEWDRTAETSQDQRGSASHGCNRDSAGDSDGGRKGETLDNDSSSGRAGLERSYDGGSDYVSDSDVSERADSGQTGSGGECVDGDDSLDIDFGNLGSPCSIEHSRGETSSCQQTHEYLVSNIWEDRVQLQRDSTVRDAKPVRGSVIQRLPTPVSSLEYGQSLNGSSSVLDEHAEVSTNCNFDADNRNALHISARSVSFPSRNQKIDTRPIQDDLPVGPDGALDDSEETAHDPMGPRVEQENFYPIPGSKRGCDSTNEHIQQPQQKRVCSAKPSQSQVQSTAPVEPTPPEQGIHDCPPSLEVARASASPSLGSPLAKVSSQLHYDDISDFDLDRTVSLLNEAGQLNHIILRALELLNPDSSLWHIVDPSVADTSNSKSLSDRRYRGLKPSHLKIVLPVYLHQEAHFGMVILDLASSHSDLFEPLQSQKLYEKIGKVARAFVKCLEASNCFQEPKKPSEEWVETRCSLSASLSIWESDANERRPASPNRMKSTVLSIAS